MTSTKCRGDVCFALREMVLKKKDKEEAGILEWIYYIRSNILQRFIFHKRVQNTTIHQEIWGERTAKVLWSSPVQNRTDIGRGSWSWMLGLNR